MVDAELWELGRAVGARLKARGETVAVAEGSAGGLVSAALLAVPGASAYYLGGAVVYTAAAHKAFLAGAIAVPEGMRGATETFARYLAEAVAVRVAATWGVGEAGAAGPANPYGDPAGHCWVAVHGPQTSARHVLTGLDDRDANMVAFATAALTLLRDELG
jgi:nicotinamide-nucleotide amidase